MLLQICLQNPRVMPGLTLAAYLITPVQRVPRYILLLKVSYKVWSMGYGSMRVWVQGMRFESMGMEVSVLILFLWDQTISVHLCMYLYRMFLYHVYTLAKSFTKHNL